MGIRLFYAMLWVLLVFLSASAQIVLKGTVQSTKGLAIPKYYIGIVDLGNPEKPPHWTVETSGQHPFQFSLPHRGPFIIEVAGVNHQGGLVIIYAAEEPDTISITLQLSPYAYKTSIDTLKIIGNWNNFDFERAELMERVDDHRFRYTRTADSDTFQYQIIGLLPEEQSINGQQSDDFIYDGGGDFNSVLYVKKGQPVTITIDTRKLNGIDQRTFPVLKADAAHAYLSIINHLNETLIQTLNNFYKAIEAYQAKHEGSLKGFSFQLDSRVLNEIEDGLNQPDLPSQEFAAISAIMLARSTRTIPAAIIQRALNILSPTSRAWAINPSTLYYLLTPKDSVHFAYNVETIYQKNPAERVRAIALIAMMQHAKNLKDDQKYREYYALLKQQFGHYPAFEMIIKRYDPNQPIQKGKKVPDFEVTSLDGNTTYRPADFKGKYVLLDFWAVWCSPCRAEMPFLHKAYEMYKDRGFTILSLSFDKSPETVKKYRQKKWPMPWYHAFVEGGFKSPIAKKFNVMGIPNPILIGPDGTIIAKGSRLRGEALLETLKRVIQ